MAISFKKLTNINFILFKILLSHYYKNNIVFKKPNDLLIDKKKICGILQETLFKRNKKYLIVGVGINLIKNPNIVNYQATNLFSQIKKKISKQKMENQIKKIFELKLGKFYN